MVKTNLFLLIGVGDDFSVEALSIACYVVSRPRDVKIRKVQLALIVKIGYIVFMLHDGIVILLRVFLIALVWGFIWRYVRPKSQLMRVFRAALLVICLLGVLVFVRITGS